MSQMLYNRLVAAHDLIYNLSSVLRLAQGALSDGFHLYTYLELHFLTCEMLPFLPSFKLT